MVGGLVINEGATAAWEGHGTPSLELNNGASIRTGTFTARAEAIQQMVTSVGAQGAFYNYGEFITAQNSQCYVRSVLQRRSRGST